ncbi:DUF1642 domain-containing protein [Listeria monocytogenes]|nr:DUF1642 domain-containing protein [Listeria monocytogenes]
MKGIIQEIRTSHYGASYIVASDYDEPRWIDEGRLIPLSPLPVIPQFVADVLQVQKEKWWWSLSESLNLKVYACTSFVKEYSVDIRIKDWLSLPSNQELFARAWMDGYEVEKEPLYYVKLPISKRNEATDELEIINMCLLLNIRSRETCISGNYRWVDKLKRTGWRTKLTEAQIKDMPEGDIYWQFAVLVDEVEGEDNE